MLFRSQLVWEAIEENEELVTKPVWGSLFFRWLNDDKTDTPKSKASPPDALGGGKDHANLDTGTSRASKAEVASTEIDLISNGLGKTDRPPNHQRWLSSRSFLAKTPPICIASRQRT